MKKGYPTESGYMGYIPNKGYVLFSSEDDYEDFYEANYGHNFAETA